MTTITEVFLVFTVIMFFVIVCVQRLTISLLRNELKEIKNWINHNHVSDFWNR